MVGFSDAGVLRDFIEELEGRVLAIFGLDLQRERERD